MGQKDPRIDAYIAKSAGFAKPLLHHFRRIVHAGCPDVEETIKWGMPHFQYKGILCQMAAFKAHCAFGFWHGDRLFGAGNPKAREAMGHLGRVTRLDELPPEKTLLGHVRKAVRLADQGVKSPRARSKPKPPVRVPGYLATALKNNARARATFDGFSPSHRREYIEWLADARTDATRERRLETTLAWLAEGKPRHWKYRS